MKRKLLYQIMLSLLIVVVAQLFHSCKKVDLQRTALVKTVPVSGITQNSATANGQIIDLGDESISEYGFAYSTSPEPTVGNQVAKASGTASTGSFSASITGLNPNTNYFVRAYLKSGSSIIYAATSLTFKTQSVTPSNTWLHYDNGVNLDGLGLNAGGDFDVAIRFSPSLLSPYDGWKITKIKFFPKVGSPVSYSLEIYSGSNINTMTFEYLQDVTNPIINTWNEISLTTPYTIDSGKELFVGYWVQGSPALSYPAGCDAGPADAEYGDLISVDGGTTWYSLSIAVPSLNYNWNIQVYVVSPGGIEKKLTIEEKKPPIKVPFVAKAFSNTLFGSLNQSLNK